jgi:hypothetical protein
MGELTFGLFFGVDSSNLLGNYVIFIYGQKMWGEK